MFKAIVHFSIQKKLFVGLTTLFLLLGGIYAMMTLPIDAVPDITNNQVQIVTVSPTLAPQEVEQLITMPIEIAMSNIMNVEEIRSVSRFGLSLVTVVFKESVPTLDARQLINEQIQTVAGEIPTELGTPELMPITTGLGEIYQYVLSVEPGYEEKYDAMELRTIQDWIVKRQLSGIPGIVEINSFGGYLKQYEVAVDPDALYSLNITIGEVFEALNRNNQNTGGSYIEKINKAYYIRSEGMIGKIKDIERIVITNRGGIPIHISDVGSVRFGSAKRFGAMTKDGEGECVGGIAMMLKGANANVVTKELEARVERVQKMLPEGVRVEPYLNRSELVDRNISTVIRNLIEGALIVFIVLIIFLGNVRAGLIVASVIPLAMLFAFILMRVFGVSANLGHRFRYRGRWIDRYIGGDIGAYLFEAVDGAYALCQGDGPGGRGRSRSCRPERYLCRIDHFDRLLPATYADRDRGQVFYPHGEDLGILYYRSFDPFAHLRADDGLPVPKAYDLFEAYIRRSFLREIKRGLQAYASFLLASYLGNDRLFFRGSGCVPFLIHEVRGGVYPYAG